MKDLQKSEIIDVLSKINDLSRGKDIYSSGNVADISIKENNVQVTLEVESHRAGAFEVIRKQVEKSLNELPNVTNCVVVLTAHASQNTNQLSKDTINNEENTKSIVLDSKVNTFIALGSGKGGVGKSTTSVNIAVSLGLEGYNVGLLDADVYGPSQPRMLGVSGRPKAIAGDMVSPMKNHGISMMSMGLLVPDQTAMVWRGPMVQSALNQMLNNVVWGNLDVMIIDLPPGTGDIQISLAQQVNLSGAVIVSTPQDVALLDVIKAISMFEKAGVKVGGMIENMSFWECPDCGRVDHIFGKEGVSEEAKKRKLPLLGKIPLHSDIREASDGGSPTVISSPKSVQAKSYREISKKLIEIFEITKSNN